MRMKRWVLLCALLALALLTACSMPVQRPVVESWTEDGASAQDAAQPADDAQEQTAAETGQQAAEPPEEKDPLVDKVSAMTLEEKVGQLFFVRCTEKDMKEKIAQYHLGGALRFGRD